MIVSGIVIIKIWKQFFCSSIWSEWPLKLFSMNHFACYTYSFSRYLLYTYFVSRFILGASYRRGTKSWTFLFSYGLQSSMLLFNFCCNIIKWPLLWWFHLTVIKHLELQRALLLSLSNPMWASVKGERY